MSLIDVYAAAVASGDIQNSLAQREVVQAFEAIIASAGKRGWPWSRRVSHQGLYVYGPVGAGKTYLMDLFYQHYPNSRKQRFHFHHFMQWVDDKLRQLQGAHDPLDRIADSIASSTQVLCLDEFLVHDVAHAMGARGARRHALR
ncbi:MAG: hypothetical protein B7X00_00540, partial [Legionella sp. 21-45-4]